MPWSVAVNHTQSEVPQCPGPETLKIHPPGSPDLSPSRQPVRRYCFWGRLFWCPSCKHGEHQSARGHCSINAHSLSINHVSLPVKPTCCLWSCSECNSYIKASKSHHVVSLAIGNREQHTWGRTRHCLLTDAAASCQSGPACGLVPALGARLCSTHGIWLAQDCP